MFFFKGFYIACIFIILMIFRYCSAIEWFSSIVLIGLIVTLLDLKIKIFNTNKNNIYENEKRNFVIVLFLLTLVNVILLFFTIKNLINKVEWMNNGVFIDEVTLFTILVAILQEQILIIINKIIKNNEELIYEEC